MFCLNSVCGQPGFWQVDPRDDPSPSFRHRLPRDLIPMESRFHHTNVRLYQCNREQGQVQYLLLLPIISTAKDAAVLCTFLPHTEYSRRKDKAASDQLPTASFLLRAWAVPREIGNDDSVLGRQHGGSYPQLSLAYFPLSWRRSN